MIVMSTMFKYLCLQVPAQATWLTLIRFSILYHFEFGFFSVIFVF
jgi:hypothetical protein